MDSKVKAWLFDIDNAIAEINFFLEGRAKNFFEYQQNLILKRAIERELEIIGEAMNRVIKSDPSLVNEITDAKDIIGLRNQVLHAYDNISDENIWAIVSNHLPLLKSEVSNLLKN